MVLFFMSIWRWNMNKEKFIAETLKEIYEIAQNGFKYNGMKLNEPDREKIKSLSKMAIKMLEVEYGVNYRINRNSM